MRVTELSLPGVLLIEPQVFDDSRGWFMETYSKKKTPQIDCDFVQDNQSLSRQRGTLRGIHFQVGDAAQAKLVRCNRGALMDFAVDLRRDSETFKKWLKIELTEENKKQLFIPAGFGHAFLTMSDNTEISYKTDRYYSAVHDCNILWSDIELGIDWGADEPILSEKDMKAPLLSEMLDRLKW